MSERQTIDPAKRTRKLETEGRVFEEVQVSGFTHLDPEVAFFTQVAALIRPTDHLLDFGAGRGEWLEDDPSYHRRWLQDFRGRVAFVDGCDLDPVVVENRSLDAAKVLVAGDPLPYEDERFDVIVSRYVFEHVEDARWLASELLRVTKPGGWICATTPNKWGYVALAARAIPNALHTRVLRAIQPHRKAEDVFDTYYRLNTKAALRKAFAQRADVYSYIDSSVPSYHFGKPILLRGFLLLHRFLPEVLHTNICTFIRKRS